MISSLTSENEELRNELEILNKEFTRVNSENDEKTLHLEELKKFKEKKLHMDSMVKI